LPLATVLDQSAQQSAPDFDVLDRSAVTEYPRGDMELVWSETKFLDPNEKREAFSRHAVGRGFDVHVLMTLDYWADDRKKLLPMWNELMRSLQLGRVIQDPTKGPVLH
jgi:hypothetical protein